MQITGEAPLIRGLFDDLDKLWRLCDLSRKLLKLRPLRPSRRSGSKRRKEMKEQQQDFTSIRLACQVLLRGEARTA